METDIETLKSNFLEVGRKMDKAIWILKGIAIGGLIVSLLAGWIHLRDISNVVPKL